MSANEFDIVICGAGVGGVSAALHFGAQGRSVLLLDKLTNTVEIFKGELLQPRSLQIFDELQVLDYLCSSGARKIDRLVCSDRAGDEMCAMDYRWLDSPYNSCLTHTYKGILDDLSANLSSNVTVRRGVLVEGLLRNAAGRVCGVRTKAGKEGEDVYGSMVVAADGRSSRLRSEVGIEVQASQYTHQVIAFDLSEVSHLKTQATTFITPEGMRVVYPMPNERGRLYVQIPKGFVNRIGKNRLDSWLTDVFDHCPGLESVSHAAHEGLDTSQVLSARRFVAPVLHAGGVPLVGDAAHSIHPMAGQGMNAAIADAAALARSCSETDFADHGAMDVALGAYDRDRQREVRTQAEFSHRFASLLTDTVTRPRFARSKYVLRRHGENKRLCYKIMHNISGMGYSSFSVLDRLQQLGLPDRNAHKLAT